jgi:hypothetical protein
VRHRRRRVDGRVAVPEPGRHAQKV